MQTPRRQLLINIPAIFILICRQALFQIARCPCLRPCLRAANLLSCFMQIRQWPVPQLDKGAYNASSSASSWTWTGVPAG